MTKLLFLLATMVLVAGCSTKSPIGDIFEGRQVDYKDSASQQQKTLRYPPNVVGEPEISGDTVSVKEYALSNIKLPKQDTIAQNAVDGVRYVKRGDLRWLEVDATPAEAWGKLLQFWSKEMGFPLVREDARLGIIETDWLDIRDNIPVPGDDFLTPMVSEFLERVGDSAERDKFVTRLEKVSDNKVEVYVAHQHIAGTFTDEGLFSNYERLPEEAALEVEMLRRLMYSLLLKQIEEPEPSIDEAVVTQEQTPTPSPYKVVGDKLEINKPFQEAWNIVQVGLNRGGFSVQDRLVGEKVIYIEYGGATAADKIIGAPKKSWLSKIIGDNEPVLYELALNFSVVGDNRVSVEFSADEKINLNAEQKEYLINLLYDYLPQQ